MVRNRFSLLTVKMNRRVNKAADQGSNHRERAVGEPLATMRLNGDPNHVNAADDHDGQAVEVAKHLQASCPPRLPKSSDDPPRLDPINMKRCAYRAICNEGAEDQGVFRKPQCETLEKAMANRNNTNTTYKFDFVGNTFLGSIKKENQGTDVVLVLVIFVIGLFECITLLFPKNSPIFCAFIACGSICTSFNAYWIQTRRIIAAVGEARRGTRLEVLIYLYCLALVITSDIDVVWVAIEQHDVQKFTYRPLTVIEALIDNLDVDLLGECLHF
ncbi:hypothetical protein OROGR_014821 [Orobanche gracilis]